MSSNLPPGLSQATIDNHFDIDPRIEHLIEELIQVAAVAVAFAETLANGQTSDDYREISLFTQDVLDERMRQEHLWGTQAHDSYKWAAILGEEVGEVNRAILEIDG